MYYTSSTILHGKLALLRRHRLTGSFAALASTLLGDVVPVTKYG